MQSSICELCLPSPSLLTESLQSEPLFPSISCVNWRSIENTPSLHFFSLVHVHRIDSCRMPVLEVDYRPGVLSISGVRGKCIDRSLQCPCLRLPKHISQSSIVGFKSKAPYVSGGSKVSIKALIHIMAKWLKEEIVLQNGNKGFSNRLFLFIRLTPEFEIH